MEKEFVPYEQALALKELGFDEHCFGFYNNADGNVWIKHSIEESIKNIYIGDFQAPTFSQAFRWFRENYEIKSNISFSRAYSDYRWNYIRPRYIVEFHCYNGFDTYEEAELECLKKLIEIIKSK